MDYPVYPCGDCAVTLQIGDEISETINREVVGALESLRSAAIPGVRELVPTYTSVCIHYDPLVLSYDDLLQVIGRLENGAAEDLENASERIVEIPVCYGGEYGPDLAFVAEYNGLTVDEVIKRHSEGVYLVYMLGFLPGFAYMGGMDETIACPRLTSPRTKIPAGSVGIAGAQTGIYPLSSPGGWQLIGRTPLKMFAIDGEKTTFALSAGDRVRFVPITEEAYREMEAGL